MNYYILDGQTPRRVTLEEWARWFGNVTNRVVDYTQITSACNVSTVFIGLDYRHTGDGPPLLFESIICGGPLDFTGARYSSWDDAVAGHRGLVRRAKAALAAPAVTKKK